MRVARRVKNEQDQWVIDGHHDLPDEWDAVLVPGERAISDGEVSVIQNAVEEFGSIEAVIEEFRIREGSSIPWAVQRVMKARNQARHEKMVGQDATADQDGFFDRLFGGLSASQRIQFAEETPRAWLRVERARVSLDRADVSMGIDAIREFNRRHNTGGEDEGVSEVAENGNPHVLDVEGSEDPY